MDEAKIPGLTLDTDLVKKCRLNGWNCSIEKAVCGLFPSQGAVSTPELWPKKTNKVKEGRKERGGEG